MSRPKKIPRPTATLVVNAETVNLVDRFKEEDHHLTRNSAVQKLIYKGLQQVENERIAIAKAGLNAKVETA